MEGLYINGEPVVMPENYKIRIVSKNPLFYNLKGTFSIPFSLPYKENSHVFGFIGNIYAEQSSDDIDFEYYTNGLLFLSGLVSITDVNYKNNSIEIYLKGDNVVFYSKLRTVTYYDIFSGLSESYSSLNDFETKISASINNPSVEKDYVAAGYFSVSDIEIHHKDDTDLSIFINRYNEFITGTTIVTDENKISLNFRMKYILTTFLNYIGYRIIENDFTSDYNYNKMILLTEKYFLIEASAYPASLTYSDYMPTDYVYNAINDFLQLIGAKLFANDTARTVKIKSISTVINNVSPEDLTDKATLNNLPNEEYNGIRISLDKNDKEYPINVAGNKTTERLLPFSPLIHVIYSVDTTYRFYENTDEEHHNTSVLDAAHNKDTSDLGSFWRDEDSNVWQLVDIRLTTILVFYDDAEGVTMTPWVSGPDKRLIHISGAAHTTPIFYTQYSIHKWIPYGEFRDYIEAGESLQINIHGEIAKQFRYLPEKYPRDEYVREFPALTKANEAENYGLTVFHGLHSWTDGIDTVYFVLSSYSNYLMSLYSQYLISANAKQLRPENIYELYEEFVRYREDYCKPIVAFLPITVDEILNLDLSKKQLINSNIFFIDTMEYDLLPDGGVSVVKALLKTA